MVTLRTAGAAASSTDGPCAAELSNLADAMGVRMTNSYYKIGMPGQSPMRIQTTQGISRNVQRLYIRCPNEDHVDCYKYSLHVWNDALHMRS